MNTSKGISREAKSPANRNELGNFLRTRRTKLEPEKFGLSDKRRRRTPGLRREEVAELAGISIDWYVRLEQGRTVRPSQDTIDALAKALRLNKVEHAHLCMLARAPHRSAFRREVVPEAMLHILKSLHLPAYITGRRWDILAWNHEATAVIADFGLIPQEERNILLHMLSAPAMKRLFGAAWAGEAKRMLALFRTTYDVWAGDSEFEALLQLLRQKSPQFSRWWENHEIKSGTGVQKLLHHPTRGLLRFQTASFQANDDPALKLSVYAPM